MANAELGVKRRCLSCNAAFFDLNRAPILCVKCGAVFTPVEFARSPPRRTWSNSPAIHTGDPAPAAANAAPALDDEVDDGAGEEATIPPPDEDDDEEGLDALGGIGLPGEDAAG